MVSNFSNHFSSTFEKLSARWMEDVHGPIQQDSRSYPAEFEGSSTTGAFGQISPPTEGGAADSKFKKKDVTQDWLEAIESK